jgi:hypothetical protein
MFKAREKDKLFVLLLELSELFMTGCEGIKSLKDDGRDNLNMIWKKTEKDKENAQMILNTIMKELDLTLITPIEREDILHLAERLVSSIASLESCAARFELFEMTTLTDEMIYFTEMICEAGEIIHQSTLKLTEKKFSEMNPGIQKIYGKVEAYHQLERRAIKELFVNYANDPVTLIKYKELYDFISKVAIKQEKVAKVLGTIIMKNA